MRVFFFSVLMFFLFIGGVRKIQAISDPPSADFNPRSVNEEKSSLGTKKIRISGRALKAENILVKEGDRVELNQPLITRKFEINQLELQRGNILEKIDFIQNRKIIEPVEPVVRDYPSLPPANFESELLNISAIESKCQRFSLDLDTAKVSELPYFSAASVGKLERLKQQKARELNQANDLLNNLKALKFEPHYITHQEEIIKKITEDIQQIDADILVENGKMQEKNSFAESQRVANILSAEEKLLNCKQQLDAARAVLLRSQYDRKILEQNYARSYAVYLQEQDRDKKIYEQALIRYNENVESQKLALFEANEALSQVDLKLSEITEVKSPYAGQISRIKIVNAVDGFINVEFTLVY